MNCNEFDYFAYAIKTAVYIEWMNEWMMHLYSALCIVVHPRRFTIMWGVSPEPPPVCSIHLDDATTATGQRRQCAHHKPATGGEERESEPIKCMRSPHTSYRWRGERVIEPIKCMRSLHTSYRWRGERVIEPIKWMGIIRRPWLTRASGRNLSRTPGLHHYSLREVPWDF